MFVTQVTLIESGYWHEREEKDLPTNGSGKLARNILIFLLRHSSSTCVTTGLCGHRKSLVSKRTESWMTQPSQAPLMTFQAAPLATAQMSVVMMRKPSSKSETAVSQASNSKISSRTKMVSDTTCKSNKSINWLKSRFQPKRIESKIKKWKLRSKIEAGLTLLTTIILSSNIVVAAKTSPKQLLQDRRNTFENQSNRTEIKTWKLIIYFRQTKYENL